MEPETLIHHLVSPICILCATQTDVDYRVLCQLSLCIDISGAVLGVSKFLLRFSHLSASKIYQPPAYIIHFFFCYILYICNPGSISKALTGYDDILYMYRYEPCHTSYLQ